MYLLGGAFAVSLNGEIKLFFDNCLSNRLPGVIISAYGEDCVTLEVKHLRDLFHQEDADRDFLPVLEQDKNWIVITADRGKDPKKEKLPVLCNQLGLSHIALTPSFHQAGYLVHKHGFLALFPQLLCIRHLPRGTRVSMGFKTYHQRAWPCLSIGGKDFDAWCISNGIAMPDGKGNQIRPQPPGPSP